VAGGHQLLEGLLPFFEAMIEIEIDPFELSF
jgi:hypothetical protein